MTQTATTATHVVTCSCAVCGGLSARVAGPAPKRVSAAKAHGLVRAAHSPLARTASGQRFGPWAV